MRRRSTVGCVCMAGVKYDGYAGFAAGEGFLEALVDWLHQFQSSDRHAAYQFVKQRLVFISSAEMYRVIEAFLPEVVTPYLRRFSHGEHFRPDLSIYKFWPIARSSRRFDQNQEFGKRLSFSAGVCLW